MRILFIVSVFILVGGCTTNNPLPNKVLLYGHGGGGFDNSALFPPNSVPAMKESLEKYRLDGIEVDVQFTQDTGLLSSMTDILKMQLNAKEKLTQFTSQKPRVVISVISTITPIPPKL